MPHEHFPNRDAALAVFAFPMLWMVLALPACLTAAPGTGARLTVTGESLPSGLSLIPGPVNGAFIQREGKALAVYGDPLGRRPAPDMVLLTEARRDVTWAARGLAQRGTKVVAPEKEAALLTHPEKFWAELREKRFHDYAQQTTKIPVEPIPVSRAVKGGDTLLWADLFIRVLDTPGYTRGAVSYLVELEGQKVAFTGDLIRDDGKLQDLFSLQDAIPEAKIGGYHGWAGRLGELMASLDRIAAEKPDLLVPLRGPVLRNPPAAIGRLQSRIRAVYANYLSIDALRWYFKDDHIRAKARRVLGPDAQIDWMPMAETLPLPELIIPISNSRLILAADQFTIFDYPGQTLHHNALLVERGGSWSAFFAGDSFTPSGIDDYFEVVP